jgi:hypothetical protein
MKVARHFHPAVNTVGFIPTGVGGYSGSGGSRGRCAWRRPRALDVRLAQRLLDRRLLPALATHLSVLVTVRQGGLNGRAGCGDRAPEGPDLRGQLPRGQVLESLAIGR